MATMGRFFSGLFIASVLLSPLGAKAAADSEWVWTADDFPGRTFKTHGEALAAVRALGGVKAFAHVVEFENLDVNSNTTTFTYASSPHPPDMSPWVYSSTDYVAGTYDSEEAVSVALKNHFDRDGRCQPTTLPVPTSPWNDIGRLYPEYVDSGFRHYSWNHYPPSNYPQCTSSQSWTSYNRRRLVECTAETRYTGSIGSDCVIHSVARIRKKLQPCCHVPEYGNPVNSSSGDKKINETDVSLPWFQLKRRYSAQTPSMGTGFDSHWTSSLGTRIYSNIDGVYGLVTPEGNHVALLRTVCCNPSYYEPITGQNYRIKMSGEFAEWEQSDGLKHTFNVRTGRLMRTNNRDGEAFSYQYDFTNRLLSIGHSGGRAIAFTYVDGYYGANSRIESVLLGSLELARYSYFAAGNLKSVQWPVVPQFESGRA